MFSRSAIILVLTLAAGCSSQERGGGCEGVSCGDTGRCVVTDKGPACECASGTVANGLNCVSATTDPCNPNPCTIAGRTVCIAPLGVARCECAADRKELNGQCVPADPCQPNPCNRVSQNICTVSGAEAQCSCNPGFIPEGAACSASPVFDCSAKHQGTPADDAHEPDECPAVATDVASDGMPQPVHTISPVGDVDFYRIAALEGRIYEVTARSTSGLRLYVDVYAGDGLTSLAFDHRGAAEIFTRFRASRSGAHFVRVRPFRSSDTGPYTLTLSEVGVDDFENEPAQARNAEVGISQEGEIQYGDDLDVLQLALLGGHNYEMSASWTRGNSLVAELIGSDQRTVLQKEQGVAPRLSLRPPYDGTYYLRYSSALATVLGKYTFTARDQGPDDHGDVPSDATTLQPSDSYAQGVLERLGDADVFVFAAVAGRIYRFNCLVVSAGSCNATLSDEVGNLLASDINGGSAQLTYQSVRTATLFVRVTSTSINPYSYRLEDLGGDDHGNTFTAATPLTPGAPPANGRMELPGDLDFFSFTASNGRIYRFTCLPVAPLPSCAVRVLTPGGVQVASGTNTTAFKATAGTFYIEVRSSSPQSSGDYTYTLEDGGLDDHGDTVVTATAISPSSTLASASIDLPGDLDVFSFNAVAGRIYRFTCAPSPQVGSCRLRLLNNTATQITSGTNTLSFKTDVSATLFVEVAGAVTLTGGYSYLLEDVGVDDHGDTSAVATPLTANAPETSALIEPRTDVDQFSFEASQGNIYTFTCSPSTSLASCSLRLTNRLGAQLQFATNLLTFKAASTGPHFIEVRSGNGGTTGAYAFRLQDGGPEDHGDTNATATPLTLGVAKSGILELAGDIDAFAVPSVAGTTYQVTVTSSLATTKQVLTPSGTLLTSSTAATFPFNATLAGNYVVRVFGSGTGAYTIKVE